MDFSKKGKDYCDQFEIVYSLAKSGNRIAQCIIGLMYESGIGTLMRQEETKEWFLLSATQEFAEAQFILGKLYIKEGEKNLHAGICSYQRHYEQAYNWFLKAAQQDHIPSMLELENLLVRGKGMASNDEEAIRWCEKAAFLGDAEALCNLAERFEFGYAVKYDIQQALVYYSLSADKGCSRAQYQLASILGNQEHKFYNLEKYLLYLRRAALNGSSSAISLMASSYALQ